MNKLRHALPLISLAVMLAACSPGGDVKQAASSAPPKAEEKTPKEPVKLEFASNASGSTLEAYKTLVSQFNAANPSIRVELNPIAKDYEALMNARMASGDLPDLFNTHGWSVMKYSEYLRPLNDQPWAANLVDEIKPIVTNDKGRMFVLPFDVDMTGLLYNPAILKELNLPVPATWDEFAAVCEAAKKAGYTPIHVGGKDDSGLAGLINRVALSLLIMDSGKNYKKELADGSFDWNQFDRVASLILSWKEKGYFNVDNVTADKNATHTAMAKNKVLFAFQSNQSITEIKKLNPDSAVNMMRIPTSNKADEPFLISGERDAVGVWKNTKHEKEALQFLSFLAEPAQVSAVAASYSIPAAIKGVKVDLGQLGDVFGQYSKVSVTNHFDRQYLPNGMWNTMKSVGTSMLSGMSAKDATKAMKTDYDRLRSAAVR
ncbi:ABC transporter substrate-binding protein [Paenibacillus hamazuiensis]|uniref:ABC transporter substrate-binding protein n=1 Tax=Paenibacillus hamazuiensis TaxID=2936508 RepID=UPI00200FB039|nr:ABC transporter substrate-binding protein [Paenibacillus hamazuiensis]